jgi:uncharacterized OB-fold protein
MNGEKQPWETIAQWEKREGREYPDDSQVWLMTGGRRRKAMNAYCLECGNALDPTWTPKWRCWHCGALYTEEEVRELEMEIKRKEAREASHEG